MANIDIPTKREIRCKVDQFLGELKIQLGLPEHSRIVLNNDCGYFEVDVVCSGSQAGTGYNCCLEPNHKAPLCYCRWKSVDFKPENF